VLSEDITDVFGFKKPTAADVTEVHPETPATAKRPIRTPKQLHNLKL
jgi:hypothetical protein